MILKYLGDKELKRRMSAEALQRSLDYSPELILNQLLNDIGLAKSKTEESGVPQFTMKLELSDAPPPQHEDEGHAFLEGLYEILVARNE